MKNIKILRHGRLLGALAIAATLVGCGGGSDSSAMSSTESTPAVVSTAEPGAGQSSTAPSGVITPVGVVAVPPVSPGSDGSGPTISGVAATHAKVGQAYSFQPSAQGAENASLTYSISGAPKWATFSSTTGRLSGTPTAADVGTNPNIIVAVSDGSGSAALAAFGITVAAVGSSTGNANLSWVAPTENTDGSVLTDLGGYVIHYGTVSKTYTSSITVSNPGLTNYVVEDLPAGTYYFSMTTSATNGAQSSPSIEASVTIS